MYQYFKIESNEISSCESKDLSNEKISSTTCNNNNKFATSLLYHNARLKVKFNGDFLKQDKVTYSYGPIVNIYIANKLTPDTKDSNVTLENCLFGAVKLKKMLVWINTNILDMALDLIQEEVLHIQVEDIVEMLLYWGWIWLIFHMLITKQEVFQFLVQALYKE